MTGFMSERELSRKSFVKAGGALVVGFSLGGAAGPGAEAAITPGAAGYNPDLTQVDSWLTINADNTITLKTSKIETGNGISTGFLEVVAEELDTDMSQMRYGTSTYVHGDPANTLVDTWVVANVGGEGGSNAMSGTGPKIRAAAVTARQALLVLASKQLGVP